jgi:hypothetical protein
VSERPGDDADGEAPRPRTADEEKRGRDDHQVVDDGRERRRSEPAPRIEDAGRHGAERQEDRAEQHRARQFDGLVELDGPETGCDRRHHDRRQDEQGDRQDRQGR